MKTCSDLEQRADPAVNVRTARGGLSNPIKNLQQRALACSVASDDAHHFALFNVERNIL